MKNKNLVTVVDSLRNHATNAKLAASTAVLVIGPAVCAYASEPAGTNLLTGEVQTAVSTGFADLKVTAIAVIGMAAVAAMSVLGLSTAVNYAIKKAKGVLSKAS